MCMSVDAYTGAHGDVISLNWKPAVLARPAGQQLLDFASILEMLGLQVLAWSHLFFFGVYICFKYGRLTLRFKCCYPPSHLLPSLTLFMETGFPNPTLTSYAGCPGTSCIFTELEPIMVLLPRALRHQPAIPSCLRAAEDPALPLLSKCGGAYAQFLKIL